MSNEVSATIIRKYKKKVGGKKKKKGEKAKVTYNPLEDIKSIEDEKDAIGIGNWRRRTGK